MQLSRRENLAQLHIFAIEIDPSPVKSDQHPYNDYYSSLYLTPHTETSRMQQCENHYSVLMMYPPV